MSEGIIYILVNEAMPNFVKIGKTTTSVAQRMRELDTTGLPLPFECYYAARVSNMDFVERNLHDAFDDKRVRKRREFFEIDPARIRSALLLVALEEVTPRNDVVEDTDDQVALNKARTKRSIVNFKMVELPVGSILTFSKNEKITCTVIDHKYVDFEGEKTSLTAAALTTINRLGYTWSKIAGPSYWIFEEETLSERRFRMEGVDN